MVLAAEHAIDLGEEIIAQSQKWFCHILKTFSNHRCPIPFIGSFASVQEKQEGASIQFV